MCVCVCKSIQVFFLILFLLLFIVVVSGWVVLKAPLKIENKNELLSTEYGDEKNKNKILVLHECNCS